MEKRVNDKAIKILKITAEHGYITVSEIMAIVGSVRQANRYIDFLLNSVSAFNSFDTKLKPIKAYYLTKKGSEILSASGSFRVVNLFKTCDYGPLAFYHHLAIIHARLALEKHPDYHDFETPRVLMTRLEELPELKPDAEVVFKEYSADENRLFHCGLELELHPKSRMRNVEKIRKYNTSSFSHLKSIIWVCSDHLVIKSVTGAIAIAGSFLPRKHRFIVYNDLLEQGIMGCRIFDYAGDECKLFL